MRPSLLCSASLALIGSGVTYAAFCVLLCCSPWLQRQMMYLHRASVPFFTYWLPPTEFCRTNLSRLQLFRLQHIARNVEVHTSDGEVLQAWHVMPSRYATSVAKASSSSSREAEFDRALSSGDDPVIVLLHGQGGTRGIVNRVDLARTLSSHLQMHVLAVDYRGFGGSSGTPSQSGLLIDTVAVWDWLVQHGCTCAYVYGQSLGAAVAVHFAGLKFNTSCKLLGLILDAPFYSAVGAAMKHPLYRPLCWLPPIRDALSRSMADKWESGKAIQHVKCPVLIFAAGRDSIVGKDGAVQLAQTFLQSEEHDKSDATLASRLVVIENAQHSNCYAFEPWLVAMASFLEAADFTDKQFDS